jgi:hypothetical protein
MFNYLAVFSSHGYGSASTVDMTLILDHPIHAKNNFQTLLTQYYQIGVKTLPLNIYRNILAG